MQRIISELQDYIYEMRFMEDISENNENKKLSYVIGEVSVAFEQIKKALIPLYKELRENHEKELMNIQGNNFGYNDDETPKENPYFDNFSKKRQQKFKDTIKNIGSVEPADEKK